MEAILPLDNFYSYLDSKLREINNTKEINYDKMTDSFIAALERLNLQVNMDAKKVGQLTSKHVEEDINARKNQSLIDNFSNYIGHIFVKSLSVLCF